MERNMVLAVIFSAAAVVGAIETVYQVYQLTVIDAAARGLKHPKLWGLLAANGNNSSGLLLYLIGRRNYPVNSMDSRQVVVMEKRKKTAGIGLVFVAVGAIGLVLCLAKKKGKIEANGIGEYRICKQSVEPVKKGRMEFSNKQKNQLEVSIGNIEMYVDKYKKFDWINCSDEELQDARSNVTRLLDLAKKVEKEFKKI